MSTSYTTGGQAVAAAPSFGQFDSDATSRGATGASGATTPQETTSGAFERGMGAGLKPSLAGRCGPICWLVGGILILAAIAVLADGGGA